MPVDRPIIFSAPMVRALLAGTKTQTRRLAKRHVVRKMPGGYFQDFLDQPSPWRLVKRRDRLWVRETVRADEHPEEDEVGVRYLADDAYYPLPGTDEARERHFLLRCYRGTDPDLDAYKPVPAIHMPRWASRLTLTVTEVRVQRLQDISEADAKAEGVSLYPVEMAAYYRVAFQDVWNRLHGRGAWDANPEVVALTFTVERKNVDA